MICRNASPTSRSEPVKPGPLGVRGVAEQQIDAAVADLGQPADVGAEAVHRRVVELPVARVQDASGVGLDHDRDVVGHRMRHPDELEPERPELDRAAASGSISRSSAARSRPCSSSFDLTSPSVSRVAHTSGTLHLAHQVGQRADVVLVRVGQHDRTHRPGTVAQVREIGQDQVDAEMLVPREGEPRVDDEAPALVLEHGHVLPDLAQAAERDHTQETGFHPASVPTAAARLRFPPFQ